MAIDAFGVSKSLSDREKGLAGLATGTAATAVGVSHNRVANAIDRSLSAGVNRIGDFRVKQVRADLPVDSQGRKVRQSGPNTVNREGQHARRKKAAGRVAAVNAERRLRLRAVKRVTGPGLRNGLALTGLTVGVPAAWYGARKLSKGLDKHDVDSAFLGGTAGAAGYQGALYSTKRIDRRIETNIAATPEHKETLAEHRKASGVPKQFKAGDPAALKYFRTYPKSIPGWKWKRATSYLHAGRTGVAATAAAAAVGGTGAIAMRRRARGERHG